jgi:hypothetical protein
MRVYPISAYKLGGNRKGSYCRLMAHAREIYAYKIHVREIHAREVHARKIYAREIHVYKVYTS